MPRVLKRKRVSRYLQAATGLYRVGRAGYQAGRAVRRNLRAIANNWRSRDAGAPPVRDEAVGGVSVQHDRKTVYSKRKSRAGTRAYRRKRKLKAFARKVSKALISPVTSVGPYSSYAYYIPNNYRQLFICKELFGTSDLDGVFTDSYKFELEQVGALSEGTNRRARDRVFMKNAFYEMFLHQTNDFVTGFNNMYDVFYFVCKKNVPKDMYSATYKFFDSDDTGRGTKASIHGLQGEYCAADTGLSAGFDVTPSASPLEYKDFTRYFRMYKKEQVILSANNTVSFNGVIKLSKTVTKKQTDLYSAIKGVTHLVVLVAHDSTYFTTHSGNDHFRITKVGNCRWYPDTTKRMQIAQY